MRWCGDDCNDDDGGGCFIVSSEKDGYNTVDDWWLEKLATLTCLVWLLPRFPGCPLAYPLSRRSSVCARV